MTFAALFVSKKRDKRKVTLSYFSSVKSTIKSIFEYPVCDHRPHPLPSPPSIRQREIRYRIYGQIFPFFLVVVNLAAVF